MKLTMTFLGVASAFAKHSYHSNMLVEAWRDGPKRQRRPDATLLIDFGASGPRALHRLKRRAGFEYLDAGGVINYPAIERVLITHLHGDHIGGLEEMAFMWRHPFGRDADSGGAAAGGATTTDRVAPGGDDSRVVARGGAKPILIGTPGLLEDLWEKSLRGGLSAGDGAALALADYFDVRPIHASGRGQPDRVTLLERFALSLIPTDHIYVNRPYDWPSFAVLMTDTQVGTTALVSGDTRFDPDRLAKLMAGARVTFHDVQLEDPPNPVHALLSQLRTLPEATRKKTYLYHYGDHWKEPRFDFVKREFAGFARARRRYVIFED